MAALTSPTVYRVCAKTKVLCQICGLQRTSTRLASFWNKQPEEDFVKKHKKPQKKPQRSDGPKTHDEMQSLSTNGAIRTRKPYTPPKNLESRVEQAVYHACQERVDNWMTVDLNDTRLKFKILTRLMYDLNHDIPNMELDSIKTMDDVLDFFSVPVKDTSSYEDLKKLDLPRNLHVQLDPLRFDPETDTMFGGRTAFPGRETVVTSLRYKAKYGKKQK